VDFARPEEEADPRNTWKRDSGKHSRFQV